MSWQTPPQDDPGFRKELLALRDWALGLWRWWPVYLFIIAAVLIMQGMAQ